MIEFYQLQQLISVAEHDTLAAAAEQLYISHSTLSRSMKKLEDELEVALFERKKKNRISLNENGKLAVEEAKKVIRQMQTMRSTYLFWILRKRSVQKRLRNWNRQSPAVKRN